jgi:ParB family chromosome partitioning protein
MSADIQAVQMIPISQIRILNPRSRNKKIFENVISNISNLGLKRPITVAPRQVRWKKVCKSRSSTGATLETFVHVLKVTVPALLSKRHGNNPTGPIQSAGNCGVL